MIRACLVVSIVSALTLAGALLSVAAHAQTVTVDQFQHPKTDKDMSFNKTYLLGVRDGLMAYNMSTEDKVFCIGGDAPLTFEQASDIVIRWSHKKTVSAGGLPLGLALLYGLRDSFPCPRSR